MFLISVDFMFPGGWWRDKVVLAAFSMKYKVIVEVFTPESVSSRYPDGNDYGKFMAISLHNDDHFNLLKMAPQQSPQEQPK